MQEKQTKENKYFIKYSDVEAKKIEWSSKSYAEAVRKITALRANAFSRI